MEDYSGWLTKAEACERLNMSTRTLERVVEEGKISKAWRSVPGLRPVVVHNPEDIEAIAQAQELEQARTKTPIVLKGQPRQKRDRELVRQENAIVASHDKELSVVPVAHDVRASVALEKKHYLTVKEASALSGLSPTLLRRLIMQKKLVAIKDRGQKIWRAALESLQPDVIVS